MRFLIVLLAAMLSSILLSCTSSTSGPKKNGDVVDCNYYWGAKSRHVCIKDMPRADCEALFMSSMFAREEACVCATRRANRKTVFRAQAIRSTIVTDVRTL
jgi:hypothetical protein